MKFKFMRIWGIGFQTESNRRPRDWQSLALTNWATLAREVKRWCKGHEFVVEKVEAVILVVRKIDHVLTNGMIHYHMMCFCQNIHPGFLARNTPTPFISDSLGSLDEVILESMCTKGTCGTHTDWTHELRSFANMKLQMPHHRGGFRITPCSGSTISAFYASTASHLKITRACIWRLILNDI